MTGNKCVTGEEIRAGPASDDLIQALQSLLIEDEEAADVIMLAISRLSYEQLQVMQVHFFALVSHGASHMLRPLWQLLWSESGVS